MDIQSCVWCFISFLIAVCQLGGRQMTLYERINLLVEYRLK